MVWYQCSCISTSSDSHCIDIHQDVRCRAHLIAANGSKDAVLDGDRRHSRVHLLQNGICCLPCKESCLLIAPAESTSCHRSSMQSKALSQLQAL